MVKITPSEILDIINQDIKQTNLEEGLRQPLCKFVTMDSEGVYCWDVVPQFEKDFDLFMVGCFGTSGLQFNTKGYEVVGLNLNQMFADYSI